MSVWEMKMKKYKVASKVSWKEMDGLIIVVNTESGAYYSLNKTASEIWKQIAAGNSEQEVSKAVGEKYDVSEAEVQPDLESCLKNWLEEKLIVAPD